MSNYRSYVLIPGLVKCGSYPFDSDISSGIKILRELLRQGVTNFIDLTESNELTSKGEQIIQYPFFLRQISDRMKINIDYTNIPISKNFMQMNQFKIENLTKALIDNNFGNRLQTYIHCRGGLYRTSLVATMLISHMYKMNHYNALEHLYQLQLRSNYNIPKEYPDFRKIIEKYIPLNADKRLVL